MIGRHEKSLHTSLHFKMAAFSKEEVELPPYTSPSAHNIRITTATVSDRDRSEENIEIQASPDIPPNNRIPAGAFRWNIVKTISLLLILGFNVFIVVQAMRWSHGKEDEFEKTSK